MNKKFYILIVLIIISIFCIFNFQNDNKKNVNLIVIKSFSMQRVLKLNQNNKLPFINNIIQKKGTIGDIFCNNYNSQAEILISTLTGNVPFKHRISNFSTSTFIDPFLNKFQTVIWDRLNSYGDSVLVIGFPYLYDIHNKNIYVFPEYNNILDKKSFYKNGKIKKIDNFDNLIFKAHTIPKFFLKNFKKFYKIDKNIKRIIRESIANDLSIYNILNKYHKDLNNPHIFIYFNGLHYLLENLNESIKHYDEIIDNYYQFLNLLLLKIENIKSTNSNTFLFSEDGNKKTPIQYRPYLPKLKDYPSIGFFLAWGKDIRTNSSSFNIKPTDITSTILYLNGIKIPFLIDGSIIFGMLNHDFYFKNMLEFND